MSATAVIDVGTNSVKLLVLDTDNSQLCRNVITTRLGEGLHTSGAMNTEAITRTVHAIDQHLATAETFGVARTNVSIVGTAACRRARNTTELADAIASATGITLEVLSEHDEARLGFLGAVTALPDGNAPTVVLDIGGGSTEFAIGATGTYVSGASVPLGAVTMTEAHFTTDPPKPEDLTNVIGAMSDEIEELTRTIPELSRITNVVGVGGTIVTVAAVELGLMEFNEADIHGFVLTRDAAEDVFRTLATEPLDARVLNPGLPRDRADIIVAGCCLLVGVMRRLSLDQITVSTHGLVNGVAARDRLKK